MRILGIDLETGASFDTPLEQNFITEIGAVIWDTKLQTPVKIYSALISDGPESCQEAIEYTGITNEMRQQYGILLEEALFNLVELLRDCDYVMAHNSEGFDKPIITQALVGVHDKLIQPLPNKVWVDSLIDCQYPSKYTNHNLTYLKGAEGILYPGHRAVFDVIAMLELNLTIRSAENVYKESLRKQYEDLMDDIINDNLNQMIVSASSPIVEVRALITFQDLVGREEAKKNKFRWNPDSKMWTKNMRKSKLNQVDWNFKWSILG